LINKYSGAKLEKLIFLTNQNNDQNLSKKNINSKDNSGILSSITSPRKNSPLHKNFGRNKSDFSGMKSDRLPTHATQANHANPNSNLLKQHYCPFCEHCNSKIEEGYDDKMTSLNDAKLYIKRALEYLINKSDGKVRYVDIFEPDPSMNDKDFSVK